MKRALGALALIAALLTATACGDSGPKGPGTLDAVVSAADLGAVVMEVSGPGILSFQGQGGSQVFSASLSPNAVKPTYRVIVVGPAGGNLHFGIQVEDVSQQLPTVSVLQAVDSANVAMDATALHVYVSR